MDYKQMIRELKGCRGIYPKLEINSCGKSVLGKKIYYAKIGNGERTVMLAAAFHGSEHITAEVSLRFLKDICLSLQGDGSFQGVNLRKGLKDRTVIIVPMVNPDGCDINIHGVKAAECFAPTVKRLSLGDTVHWNANARGVDINHNFPAGWELVHKLERKAGIFGPAPSKYGGMSPVSEPETDALMKLCDDVNPAYVCALHSQGEVIYWNYGEHTPAVSEKMAQVMAATSGYALDVPVGTAVGGGFKDWFIDCFHRPGFTVEMGMGQNPLPSTQAKTIYETLSEMLTIFLIM